MKIKYFLLGNDFGSGCLIVGFGDGRLAKPRTASKPAAKNPAIQTSQAVPPPEVYLSPDQMIAGVNAIVLAEAVSAVSSRVGSFGKRRMNCLLTSWYRLIQLKREKRRIIRTRKVLIPTDRRFDLTAEILKWQIYLVI